MLFKDRRHAGELLASKLEEYRGFSPLILAVPRGGVVVAEPVWQNLGGSLDLVITRKIGAPGQPELAIGASTGEFVLWNKELIAQLRASQAYLDQAARVEQAEVQRRLRAYRGNRPMPRIRNELVILVDDGVATGYTLLAALRSLRRRQPQKLVLAVPVGPPQTLAHLKTEVDHLCCLEAPPHFTAVGRFYLEFNQVEDETVLSILRTVWRKQGEN